MAEPTGEQYCVPHRRPHVRGERHGAAFYRNCAIESVLAKEGTQIGFTKNLNAFLCFYCNATD